MLDGSSSTPPPPVLEAAWPAAILQALGCPKAHEGDFYAAAVPADEMTARIAH